MHSTSPTSKLSTIFTALALTAAIILSNENVNYVTATIPITTQVNRANLTLSGHTAPIRAIAISPNNQIIASGSDDKTIKLWNFNTGKLLRTLTGHKETISSLAISPDNQILVSSSIRENTIKLWNIQTGQLIRTLNGHSAAVTSINLSKDGQTIASASMDKTVRLWNIKTGKLQHTLKAEARSVIFSPDSKTLYTGGIDGTIKLWNLSNRKLITTLTPPKPISPILPTARASSVLSLAISPDGQTLINGGFDDSYESLPQTDAKNLKVWNLKTRKLIHNFSIGAGAVDTIVISPNSQNFVTGGLSHKISIWDVKTGKLIRTLEGHAGGIYGLAISKDGKTLISGSGDKSIKNWQL